MQRMYAKTMLHVKMFPEVLLATVSMVIRSTQLVNVKVHIISFSFILFCCHYIMHLVPTLINHLRDGN